MAGKNDENTIFLTEKEAERIKTTVQERLERCAELVGHTREPRDSHSAISQATGASLMLDMGNMTQERGDKSSLPVITVGNTYPPCTVSLKNLRPMKLTDLRMETHHRGRSLTVKRASPVVTLTARSWTMVQDEAGETERLEVYLHKSKYGEDILESASAFTIKEPYFTMTDQSEATLRIDHPSDLVCLESETATGDLLSSPTACGYGEYENIAVAEESARNWKEMGNAALRQQDLKLAWDRYTKGLKLARQAFIFETNPDLARDLHRNRAHVNLLLNRLDEAIFDAKASISRKNDDQQSRDLNGKAFFRAGCAAYNQGEYYEAKSFFEEQQKLMPNDKSVNLQLRRVNARIREKETGAYDLKKLKAGISQPSQQMDVATFIRNTEIKDSTGRGRGLFATRNIPAGEIVICEKAFCVENQASTAITYDVRDKRIRVSPIGLTESITQKLLDNPSQIAKVMDLYGDYQGDSNSRRISRTADGPIVDSFRVHDIMSRNAFGGLCSQAGKDGKTSKANTGLWVWAAYINHSCVANTEKEYIGDVMILRAARPITAGEEIFISYSESSDFDERQQALMTTWGFECDCALCTAERADNPATRKKRRELASEAEQFVEQVKWTDAKRLALTKAQRLARAIDGTYDAERYRGLPRVATQGIREWLVRASRHRCY
ncbi:SET and MYND domain-containing protein [Colletotrichum chlorophyti]|uniref:SET and MYND domain-containing protein n=1 Tax=Colletotrichum chlorophyti TaxID=708187 RepID=A0A1Q8RZL8_9PEZI|nr:SET and MYND domain-containing protein [Colletotrichum chlorophyti]